MKAAGASEDGLGSAQSVGQLNEDLGVETEIGRGRLKAARADRVDGSLAADATTGGGKKVAAHFIEVGQRFGCERGFDDVAAIGFVLRRRSIELEQLITALDDAFREEEACGEFGIVAGSTHGDAERIFTDADFERFLGSEVIVFASEGAVGPFLDLREAGAPRRLGQETLRAAGPAKSARGDSGNDRVSPKCEKRASAKGTRRRMAPKTGLARTEGFRSEPGVFRGVVLLKNGAA